MKYLTISLSNLYQFVTEHVLEKYKLKVEELIDCQTLRGEEYKAVLKVMNFLNHINWRHENLNLIRKCNFLIKNNIDQFSANNILVVNEVRPYNFTACSCIY